MEGIVKKLKIENKNLHCALKEKSDRTKFIYLFIFFF